MADITDTSRDDTPLRPSTAMTAPEVRAWFVREVLPHEYDDATPQLQKRWDFLDIRH